MVPARRQLERTAAGSPWGDRTFLCLALAACLAHFFVAAALWTGAVWLGTHEPLELLSERLRAPDAATYHHQARALLDYWHGHRHTLSVDEFSLVVGALYRVAPPHPLSFSLLAALCYLGVALASYCLAARIGASRGLARAVALLVCLWPTTLAWSALPLKEPLVLLAVLVFLWCLLALGGAARPAPARLVALAAGLAASAAALVFLRFYFWYFLGPVCALHLAAVLACARGEGRWRRWAGAALGALAVAVVLGAGVSLRTSGDAHFDRHATGERQAPLVHGPKVPLPASPSEQAAITVNRDGNRDPRLTRESLLGYVLRTINETRAQFARQGGATLAPEAREGPRAVLLPTSFDSWRQGAAVMAGVVGSGLRDLVLFPYPWQRWPAGPWRPANLAVTALSLLWYALLPGLLAGAVIYLKRSPAAGLTLLAWGLGLGLLLAVAVLNRGTLFRLREMALMPMLVLWHPWPYLQAARLWKKGPETARERRG